MFVLLFSFLALAADPYISIPNPTSIDDPQNLLAQVDQTLGERPFIQSHTCDREAPFHKYVDNCNVQCPVPFLCVSVCEDADIDYSRYAVGCEDNLHGIYSDLGDVWEFNSEGFQSVNNNPVRLFLMDLQNFTEQKGEIVLEKIEPTKFTISSTGEKVDAFHLTGHFYHEGTNYADWFLITYSPHLPLIAQPLRYRTRAITTRTPYGGTTWIRFLGFPEE